VIKQVGHEYKSIFIYAKFDGPLISLKFATLSGGRLGFGFHSMVRPPTMEQLNDFPLINNGAGTDAGNNPMKILDKLRKGVKPWITSKRTHTGLPLA
jgi:hypothetical protein